MKLSSNNNNNKSRSETEEKLTQSDVFFPVTVQMFIKTIPTVDFFWFFFFLQHWFISLLMEFLWVKRPATFCLSFESYFSPSLVFWVGFFCRQTHLKQAVGLFCFTNFYLCWRSPKIPVMLSDQILNSVGFKLPAGWLGWSRTCWSQCNLKKT